MKFHVQSARLVSVLAVLGMAGAAFAQTGAVPGGVTGLWRFQDSTNKLKATVGTDLTSSSTSSPSWWSGPWTMIGVPGNAGAYADGGLVQDWSWEYLTCTHGIPGANGGGSYINEYTIAMDVKPDPNWNSLYQTAGNAHGNDGDLWINATDRANSTIGVGGTEGVGYSSQTFDGNGWHRIVLSVDNGNFFRVFVDGTLFVDAPGRNIDGRFSLNLDNFHLFADDNWEDAWTSCGTVAVWGRALTNDEAFNMGGWLNGSPTPTALMIPDPATLSLAAFGGLVCLFRRNRK